MSRLSRVSRVSRVRRAIRTGPAGDHPERPKLEAVPRAAWAALVLTSMGTFLTAMDMTSVTVALPSISREFSDSSRATISFVLSGYTMTMAALFLIAGRLAERLGPKKVFLAGLALFGTAAAVSGLAPSPGVLIAARCLQGAGGAMIAPSAIALSLPLFPVSRRSTAVALTMSLASAASALGPTAGAALASSAGWRWIFFANLPSVALVFLLGRRRLPAVPPSRKDDFDMIGVPLGSLSVALLVLATSHGRTWGWTHGATLACLTGAALLLPVFVRRSLIHPRPLLDLTLFRFRTYAYGTAAAVTQRFTIFGFYVLLPVFFTDVMGYSTWKTGLAMVPNPIFGMLISVPLGRLTDRVGPRLTASAATVAAISGLLWWSTFLGPEHGYVFGYLPGSFLWGAAMGVSQAAMTSGSLRDLPGARFAVATAVQNTIGQLSASLGLAFAIALLGDTTGPDAVDEFHRTYRVLALIGLATLALCWRGLPGRIVPGASAAPRDARPVRENPPSATIATARCRRPSTAADGTADGMADPLGARPLAPGGPGRAEEQRGERGGSGSAATACASSERPLTRSRQTSPDQGSWTRPSCDARSTACVRFWAPRRR